MRKYTILSMLLCIAVIGSAVPALAAEPTTEVHITKYASDETTILT